MWHTPCPSQNSVHLGSTPLKTYFTKCMNQIKSSVCLCKVSKSPCLSQGKGREKGINLHFHQKIFLWFPNFAVRLDSLLQRRGNSFEYQFSTKHLIEHELWNIPNFWYYVTVKPKLLWVRMILSKIGFWIKIFRGSVFICPICFSG